MPDFSAAAANGLFSFNRAGTAAAPASEASIETHVIAGHAMAKSMLLRQVHIHLN
ncbi:hypothetical protein [Sinomonas cyclohexanicum]|uniref:hypothetical protein n=1 Tax=Sinomonas cyclohexanicum TaxID=322009 RepID=UPI001E2FD223|nr:hypothetical protein [Corynebacterium cyclohexanicum]